MLSFATSQLLRGGAHTEKPDRLSAQARGATARLRIDRLHLSDQQQVRVMAVKLAFDDAAARFAAEHVDLIAAHDGHRQVVVDGHAVGDAERVGLHVVDEHVVVESRALVQVVRP